MCGILLVHINLGGNKDSDLFIPSDLAGSDTDLLHLPLSKHISLGFSTSGVDDNTSASGLFKQRAGRQGAGGVSS
jgi:hypothetical protein